MIINRLKSFLVIASIIFVTTFSALVYVESNQLLKATKNIAANQIQSNRIFVLLEQESFLTQILKNQHDTLLKQFEKTSTQLRDAQIQRTLDNLTIELLTFYNEQLTSYIEKHGLPVPPPDLSDTPPINLDDVPNLPDK